MTNQSNLDKRAEQLGRLWWLVDAPLFADARLIERFHDAIVWPEVSDAKTEVSRKNKIESNFSGDAVAGVKGKLDLPSFIDWLGPKLEAEGKLSVGYNRSAMSESADTVIGKIIENSERKLIEITAEYLSDFKERILFVDAPGGEFKNYKGERCDRDFIAELLKGSPRPLVFIDTIKESPIIPTMIELESGGFCPAFKRFEDELFGRDEISFPSDEEDFEATKEYWKKIRKKFSSRFAMEVIEECCDGNRIGWIDFRMLFSTEGSTLHLHVAPGGRYHTGTFAYNFVHRSYKHGCRIVGTLKSGNDVNVLAIYDK